MVSSVKYVVFLRWWRPLATVLCTLWLRYQPSDGGGNKTRFVRLNLLINAGVYPQRHKCTAERKCLGEVLEIDETIGKNILSASDYYMYFYRVCT